jgi:Heterokaryon incompatibility protein (HET)
MALQSRADSPENFDLIRTWLSKCEQHPRCHKPLVSDATDTYLPKRLIYIPPDDSVDSIKLVLGVDIDVKQDHRYLALSHCWGSDPNKIPKTDASNLDNHLQCIPPEKLSKTFQDAIVLAKELGIRFLWIDSLCILQGSDDEFQEEIRRMHLVYGQAYCTIAAQDSSNGEGGLFIPRHDSTQLQDWDEEPSGPLSSRGWAFQELVISPRVIHFTVSRILWECRICAAAEDSPYMLYRALAKTRYPKSFCQWRLFDGHIETWSTEPNLIGPDYSVYTRWMEAVETYSWRELTFNSDKLAAISGLVSVFASMIDDRYIVGHWYKDFIRSLCWIPADDQSSTQCYARSDSYPSWAWTSYHGRVKYPCFSRNPNRNAYYFIVNESCKLIAVNKITSNNPKQATRVVVRISGRIVHGCRVTTTGLKLIQSVFKGGLSANYDSSKYMISSADWNNSGRFEYILSSPGQSNSSMLGKAFLDYSNVAEQYENGRPSEVEMEVSLLIIASYTPSELVHGLILLPQEDGTFRRIGILSHCYNQLPSWPTEEIVLV